LDFESDEYFDVDSELLLDGSMTGDMVPSVDLPLDNPLDVEEDKLFHDTDDNTSRGGVCCTIHGTKLAINPL